MADEQKTLTMDEALAILDRHAAEEEAQQAAAPNKKNVKKVKDLLLAGAKQGHGGLGRGTRKQLAALEKEGY